jgi:hypothetical protein
VHGSICVTSTDDGSVELNSVQSRAKTRMLDMLRYMVRQLNSRNEPVKAKFVYLFSSVSSRVLKLRTLRDDGATAGNNPENRFPEYLTVTSRCFAPDRNVADLYHCRWLSQVNKLDCPFL